MSFFRKWWVAILVIAISLGLLVLWGGSTQRRELDNLESIAVQLVIMFIGSFGTLILGELRRGEELLDREGRLTRKEEQLLARERELRVHARERYRRLRTLIDNIDRVAAQLSEIEEVPRLTLGGETERKLADYMKASQVIIAQSYLWTSNIRDCLDFWNDFAPEQVGVMHEELLGRWLGE